jgi:cysteine-rich repeat protein
VELESLSPALLVDIVVPILEAKFLALDVAFTKLLFSRLELPRIQSESVGSPAGFELFIDQAMSDRSNDNGVRVTGDLAISAICGDGAILGSETCDDGNDLPGDGCRPDCQVALGYSCSGEPSACLLTCGNSFVDAGEQCDDGGLVNGDGCSSTCQHQDATSFQGSALGGFFVSVRVNGVWVDVATEGCEPGVVIAQRVAHAINAEPVLSLLYPSLSAGASGVQLYVTGSIDDVLITDPGLSPSTLFADGVECGAITTWSRSVS